MTNPLWFQTLLTFPPTQCFSLPSPISFLLIQPVLWPHQTSCFSLSAINPHCLWSLALSELFFLCQNNTNPLTVHQKEGWTRRRDPLRQYLAHSRGFRKLNKRVQSYPCCYKKIMIMIMLNIIIKHNKYNLQYFDIILNVLTLFLLPCHTYLMKQVLLSPLC